MARQRLSGDKRRDQVTDAVLRILAVQGVHRLTAAEIAAAVGITDGTLFRHFKNKDEILAASISKFEELLAASIPAPETAAAVPPLDRLRRFFLHRLHLVRQRPEVLCLAFDGRLEEAAGPEGACRVREIVARSRRFIRECLAEAQTRGEVASEIPADVLAWMVMGTMRGAAVLEMADGQPDLSADAVWQALACVLTRSASR